jgi:hypothetical protein
MPIPREAGRTCLHYLQSFSECPTKRRNIRCVTVPAKHRVDAFLKLDAIGFVDTAGVHPKVLQAIESSLFSAEPDLLVSILILAGTIYQISVCDLFFIRPHVCERIAYSGILPPPKSLVRLNSPALLRCRRRIIIHTGSKRISRQRMSANSCRRVGKHVFIKFGVKVGSRLVHVQLSGTTALRRCVVVQHRYEPAPNPLDQRHRACGQVY